MGRYGWVDDAGDAVRRFLQNSGAVLPPPGAARAAASAPELIIDPAIIARAQASDGAFHPGAWPSGTDTWAAAPVDSAARSLDGGVPAAPDFDLGSDLWRRMDRSAGAADNLLRGRTNNLRNQPFSRPAQAAMQDANSKAAKMQAAMKASAERGEVMTDAAQIGVGAAAAGGLGYGAYALSNQGTEPKAEAGDKKRYVTDIDLPSNNPPVPPAAPAPAKPVDPLFDEKTPLTSTGGAAELANQSRPVPSVQTSDDPRAQAQALIAQLNQMRRTARGEVPEAAQMMKEINRLLALTNQRRNAAPPTASANDPHAQAQSLLAQLNQMRQRARGEVPQAQQIMAEVRRLQALGDQQRNAAQTR